MKKIVFFIVLLTITISTFAQKDVTKFMGIPIDGFKPEMIKKLKEKGFVSSTSDKNILEGEFNGTQVNVHVATNNNKVCRIMLCDAHQMDETDIKIRFNKLCQQFKNNSKYASFDDYTIPEDEDISYEMGVHNKRYESVFYQIPVVDSITIQNDAKKFAQEIIKEKYSERELANPTADMIRELTKIAVTYATDLISKKSVWFMISELYGKYVIIMYYDNEYNRANGEDL